MKLIRQKFIKRADLRAHPDRIYLFGDNLEEVGYGGQAKEMRGELNAVGIPTKKSPSLSSAAFFTDDEYLHNTEAIDRAFCRIPLDVTAIVIPQDGLGTGLAQLKTRAPRTFAYLQEWLTRIEGWERNGFGI